MSGKALSWSLRGNALEVELKRPPCNEIGLQSLGELEQLAEYLERGADGARAMIIHSSIPAGFCAGADLRELHDGMAKRQEVDPASITVEVRDFLDRIHNAFNTIDAAPITTIAAVHGFCFGGGFELALTCDQIIAEKSARFAFPELRLGLVPGFGGIPRLRRDLGNALIRDLLLTGRSINAKKAHQVGLISQVVPRGEALEAARRVAEQAARFDRDTAAAAKAFVKPIPYVELQQERDLFIELLASAKVREALRVFVESDDVRPYLP